MRRKDKRKYLIAGIITVVILIILIIIFSSSSSDEEVTDNNNSLIDQNTINNEEQIILEPNVEEIIEETEVVEPEIVEEEVKELPKLTGICGDYLLRKGDVLELENYEINLIQMGKTSVRISVNDKSIILNEGAREKENGLSLEIQDNKLMYFDEDNKDNLLQIRIGCDREETPDDKYVEQALKASGNELCQEIYSYCESKFVQPEDEMYENVLEFDFCDDYKFFQGESKTFGDYVITVDKIGRDVAYISLDDEEYIISTEEYVRIKNVGVELKEGNANYFSDDDSDNSVELTIGCEGSIEPQNQYIDESVYDKGNSVCNDLINLCEKGFDVSVED